VAQLHEDIINDDDDDDKTRICALSWLITKIILRSAIHQNSNVVVVVVTVVVVFVFVKRITKINRKLK